MFDFKTCAAGDPVACASAIVEWYRLTEKNDNTAYTEDFQTCDVGFARGGCEVFTVNSIGGPGGEVVLKVFQGDVLVGWVDTGWIN